MLSLTKDDIFYQSLNDIATIMDSPNQNYFLNTKSEIPIDVKGTDLTLSGRIDFIHRDAVSNTPLIFDGKGTDTIGKNINDDQLFYYALLYKTHYNEIPAALGFFYYKFNLFKPVEFNESILQEFKKRLTLDINKIIADTEFNGTPSPKACQYCEYKTVCQDYAKYKAEHTKESKLELADTNTGVIDINI